MTYVAVKHEVKDYDSWRKLFDEHKKMRKSSGEQSSRIFRGSSNRNEIFGLFKWESKEKAKKFFESKDLKEKMKEAGVSGEAHVHYLDET
ncbi:MAG: cyclase [Candidatus Aenigmatarchaeota archaeon]|nr:cyclase [Nanoarchaeota archaeon]